MIIPVKTLNNAGHIAAKLIDFSEISQKIQRNRLFFTDCFLAKFPSEISRETGRISYEFAPENPWKFDFFPPKSREMGRFFREFWLFSREIHRFFREFAPENPAKFCFFFREISEALLRVFPLPMYMY